MKSYKKTNDQNRGLLAMLLIWALILAAAFPMLLFSGCASIMERESSARIAVTYATWKAIGDDDARGDRVIEIAGGAREALGRENASLALLDEYVRRQIDWDRLDRADRLLIDALLTELRAELEARIGGGLLDGESRLRLAKVLDWISAAAGEPPQTLPPSSFNLQPSSPHPPSGGAFHGSVRAPEARDTAA